MFAHQTRLRIMECGNSSVVDLPCNGGPKSYGFITGFVTYGGILLPGLHVSDFSDCVINHLFTSRKKTKENVNVKLSSRKAFPRAFLWGKSVTNSGNNLRQPSTQQYLKSYRVWGAKILLHFTSLLCTFSAEDSRVAGTGHGSWRPFHFQDLPAAASGFLYVKGPLGLKSFENVPISLRYQKTLFFKIK